MPSHEKSKKKKNDRNFYNNDTIEFICGFGAGGLTVTVTHPFYIIWCLKYEINDQSKLHWMQKISAHRNFFKGMSAPFLGKAFGTSIMFGTYNCFYQWIAQDRESTFVSRLDKTIVSASFGASCLSGTMEALVMPLERIHSLLNDSRYHGHFKNHRHCMWQLRRYGLSEYYRGFIATAMRNSLSTFLYFTIFDDIQAGMRCLLRISETKSTTMNLLESSIIGGICGTCIALLTYPLSLLKVRMQSGFVGSEQFSLRKAIRELYEERFLQYRLMRSMFPSHLVPALIFWAGISFFSDLIRISLPPPSSPNKNNKTKY